MKRLLAALFAIILAGPAFGQTIAATTNSSTTIATGNTFQTILSAVTSNNQRRSLTIQNNNTNGDNCWIFIGSGGATKATSILLGQGGSFQRYSPYIPADVIQATCTTSSDSLYVDIQ